MSKLLVRFDGHIHTAYSDGGDSLRAMAEAAVQLGLEAIAVTDHVRRTTDWLDTYLNEIEVLRSEYSGRLAILSGFEAKVIDLSGNLDAREEFYDRVDVVVGAFHRLPTADGFMTAEHISRRKGEAVDCWFRALRALLCNPHVHIIGHLGAEFARFGLELSDRLISEVVELLGASGKIVEINTRYGAPPRSILDRVVSLGLPIIFGSDSHSVQDLHSTHMDQGRVLESMLGGLLPRVNWIPFKAVE